MFTVNCNPTFTRRVAVRVPAGHDVSEQSMLVTFRAMCDEQLEQFDLRTAAGSKDLLRAVVVEVDDLIDEQGAPVPWTAEVREGLLGLPYVRTALGTAYFRELAGAREGN